MNFEEWIKTPHGETAVSLAKGAEEERQVRIALAAAFTSGQRNADPGWIALAERTPAIGQAVLVYPDEGYDEAGIDTFGWDGVRPIFIGEGITHWMPLPNPPPPKEC